jgi:dihydroorotate dehydrogenase (NAD+) catalytic subunit
MAVDWRRRRPKLAHVTGGLSGPAIKPVNLRMVWQVSRAVKIPVIGVGGILSAEDVMDYLVAGATAVQVGTANFIDPRSAARIVDDLPALVAESGARSIRELVGTLKTGD